MTAGPMVLVSEAGGVATVTLNRPDKLNAFTVPMVDELAGVLDRVSRTTTVRCIVLTGAGRAFCAGADMGALTAVVDGGDAAAGRALVDGARRLLHLMRGAPQPVLCSLNGVAAGGGANLALGCDLRIASDTARIGQVFAKIGLHPDWGGSYFLPRMIGTAAAFELFLSAELVDAPRLLALGLVNRVVPADALAAATADWARRIAAAPPAAVERLKQNLYASGTASLDEMLDRELEAQLACFASGDFAEGLTAFREKREPHFTGR